LTDKAEGLTVDCIVALAMAVGAAEAEAPQVEGAVSIRDRPG
jgi:hypothetical protein